jgi:hypothetical protein
MLNLSNPMVFACNTAAAPRRRLAAPHTHPFISGKQPPYIFFQYINFVLRPGRAVSYLR